MCTNVKRDLVRTSTVRNHIIIDSEASEHVVCNPDLLIDVR